MPIERLYHLVRTDPLIATVHELYKRGDNYEYLLETALLAVIQQRNQLTEELLRTAPLVPKRIQKPDGSIAVWYPPEDLIPLTTTEGD